MEAVLSKIRQEIARGVTRKQAIAHARKAGATLQAIGEVLGVTRQRVRQILSHQ
jgi:DNA-directed RNA polymerase sigma subunit (sigma70/sigma32)